MHSPQNKHIKRFNREKKGGGDIHFFFVIRSSKCRSIFSYILPFLEEEMSLKCSYFLICFANFLNGEAFRCSKFLICSSFLSFSRLEVLTNIVLIKTTVYVSKRTPVNTKIRLQYMFF